MNLSDVKRSARVQPTAATIISDGCREYVIEIKQAARTAVLRDRRGETMRFRSLAEAKDVMKRAEVPDMCLAVRIAADEACAGPTVNEPQFATMQIAHS